MRSGKAKILIVDDSALNREMLTDMLKDRFIVDEAEDGAEAISILDHHASEYSLVLLDIIMPVADGFEVLAHLNSRGWIGYLPIIVMSSDDDRATVRRSFRLGAADFINRPYDPHTVRQRVLNVITLYDRQKQMEKLIEAKTHENLEKSELMTSILGHIVEFRNGESGPHVTNIKRITSLLLHELASLGVLPSGGIKDIPIICDASALHDIGKIAIPYTILNKPGKLTDEEYEIVKTHCAYGANMLEKMIARNDEPLIEYARDICRWHHERIDGSGYPDGLVGAQIPLHAQVVALADVYEALTADRCYRPAFPVDEAMYMITSGKCGAFDPMLIHCLERLQPQLIKLRESNVNGTTFYSADAEYTPVMKELEGFDMANRIAEASRQQIRFLARHTAGYCMMYTAEPSVLTLSPGVAERLGCPEIIEEPLKSNRLPGNIKRRVLPEIINLSRLRTADSPEFELNLNDDTWGVWLNLKCRTVLVDGGRSYHGFICVVEEQKQNDNN